MSRLPARRPLTLALLLPCLLAVPATAHAATTSDLYVTPPSIDGGEEPVVGGVSNYSYTVVNNGPDTTTATVTETLGEAEELVSVDSGRGSCTQTSPIVCDLGEVAAGAEVQITAQVRFTKASAANTHRAQVVAASDNFDPYLANNEASVTNTVAAEQGADPQPLPQISNDEWERSQSRLKVQALVTPVGAGKVYFEYGTSSMNRKSRQVSVSGTREQTVKITLSGLKMNTQYRFRPVLVVGGKTYRGKTAKARTMGKLKYGPLTLKAVKRTARSVSYTGKLGDGFADAPGACKGTVRVDVYTLQGADLLHRTTRMKKDCTYKITIPFGRSQASKYGKRGQVLTQARFSGNKAVSSVGSNPDRP